MKHFKKITALMIFLLIGLFVFSGSAYAVTDKTLTVGSGSGSYGDIVAVPITIDNPTGVGGAAFTLSYDPAVFEFQGLEEVSPPPISDGANFKVPAGSVLNDQEYYNPYKKEEPYSGATYDLIVPDTGPYTWDNPPAPALFFQTNVVTDLSENLVGQVMVAAASATSLQTGVIFNAKFLIKEGSDNKGTYPIGLNRTIILNPAAGYDAASFIPVLVGMPAQEANAQGYYETPVFTTTLVKGNIEVKPPAASLFTISGNVTYEGGNPAANGTPVVLKKRIDGVYVSQVQTTVSSGSYSFADNLAGNYRVCVRSLDPNFYNKCEDFEITNADVTNADVILPAAARVSGTVTINDCYLPGLKVKVMNGTQVVGVYSVNSDYSYQSGPLPPGIYTAYAVYGSLTSNVPIDELAGSNWVVTLYTINGTVSGLTSGAAATVTAGSADGWMMKTVVSDLADGSGNAAYTISNLVPAVDYKVSAVAEGLPVIYYDGKTAFTEADLVNIFTADATANFNYDDFTQGTISGVITEGTDNTVSGIGVFAFNMNTYALVSVVTNGSGEYDLTLSPGSYELFVIKNSGTVFYYDAESVNNVTQNEAKADILEVTASGELINKDMDVLECDNTLTGKVTYERSDGNPVAFALITATSGDKKAITITGLDGRYTLNGLCDGLVYTVEMDPQAGNYGIQTKTITAGTDTTCNFIIDTGHVLSGTVKDSVTEDGIANAMIYLRDQETNALVGGRMYFSESGSNLGSYSIRDIPTGIYTLVVSHPEYSTYTEPNDINTAYLVIESDTSKDIPLVQGAHFWGKVLDGGNGDVPLGGVLIIVTRVGGTPVYAVTNNTGDYAVYGLDAANSDYIILAQKRGYVRQVKTLQQPAIGTGTEVKFTLVYPDALFDLSGVITSDCGGGTPPVTGALVVVSSATEKFFSSTTTNSSGEYSFQNLPQATNYRFVIVPGGSLQVYMDSPMTVTGGSIASGTAEKDVTLPCGSEISGSITWTGTSTAYVLLYTVDNVFVDFTTADASDGTYTFTGLTAGDYKVLAFASGNTPEWYNGRAGIADADIVVVPTVGDINIDLTQ